MAFPLIFHYEGLLDRPAGFSAFLFAELCYAHFASRTGNVDLAGHRTIHTCQILYSYSLRLCVSVSVSV